MPPPRLEVPKVELPSFKIEVPPPGISVPSADFGVSQGLTKEQFVIKNDEFSKDCTGAGILEVYKKDEGFQAVALTDIHFFNKETMNMWCKGLVHILRGRVNYEGYIFESDPDNPLQFSISDKGYVYQRGKGTITIPEGKVIKLPLGDGVESTVQQ